jgi:hypothetical protein
MLKLIYAAQRNPALSPSDFIRRWRKHGAFTMSLPNWEHALTYVQTLPVAPTKPEHIDALAIYSANDTLFSDTSSRGQEIIELIEADERETFATQIPQVAMWVSEQVIVPGPFGGYSLYVFFNQHATATQWLESQKTVDLARVVLNTRTEIAQELGADEITVIPSGLDYEAVIELNSLDLSALTSLATSVPSDQALAVLGQEAPLWDVR